MATPCSPYPVAAEAGASRPLPQDVRSRLRDLAASWLAPFASRGVVEADLLPRLGEDRSRCDRAEPSRICPLLIVHNGTIIMELGHRSRLFAEPLPTCARNGTDSPGGASMRRLLVVVRMLRSALQARPWLQRTSFAVRVCVDEFCHGMFEGRALPWLTMASCASQPSLPAVQWNTLHGRDTELADWDNVLDSDRRRLARIHARWEAREPKAVWRGSAGEAFVTNMHWTANRTLTRDAIHPALWKQQGRAALIWQHFERPDLYDIYMRRTAAFAEAFEAFGMNGIFRMMRHRNSVSMHTIPF